MWKALRLLAIVALGALASVSPALAQCPVACGDCDQNGTVNVLDSLEIAQIVAGNRPGPAAQGFVCCDVDADGRITLVDAQIVAQAGFPAAALTCAPLLPPPEVPGAVQLCVDTPAVAGVDWDFRLDSIDPLGRNPLTATGTAQGVGGSAAMIADRWRAAINALPPLSGASGNFCYRAYRGQPSNCFIPALADCATNAIVAIPSPDPAIPRVTNPVTSCSIPTQNRCAYTADLIADSDGDKIVEGTDNCVDIFNSAQRDTNGNGIGDVCDRCPLFPDTVYARGSCAVDPTIVCITAADCPGGPCESIFEWRTAIDYKYVIGDFMRSPDIGTYVFNPPDVDGTGNQVPVLQTAPLDQGLWFLLRTRTCPAGNSWQTPPGTQPGRTVLP